MHRRLLALVATASLLSLPALADEHGNGHGRANTNIHTTTVMNGTVVKTHTVSNPAQTFTQTHVHKAKVKRHSHKRVVTKVVTHHHHEERND